MKPFGTNQLIYDNPSPEGWKLFKQYLKLKVYDLRFWMKCTKPQSKSVKPNYISLCTIFKNEAPFMKEWLEFHLLMGINHFYMYNNNSTDDYMSVLKPYVDRGIVTLIEWPDIPGQLSAYKHFYNTYRHESQWVSFLDMDEFICPREAKDIPTWLEDYKQYPLIMLYWRMFGTSGQMEHDYSQLVTEQYTVCWDKYDTCGKLLWNTDYDIDEFYPGIMHNFTVHYHGLNATPVNVWHYPVRSNIHRTGKSKPSIQVNHYFSKSYATYKAKHVRGDAVFLKSPRTFEYFLESENLNVSSDYTVYRFIIQLKLKLRENDN